MKQHEALGVECRGQVAYLTLNRPTRGNAIDLGLAQALLETAIELEGRDDIRAVVLSGAGRMFCVGGDIESFASAGRDLPSAIREIITYVHTAAGIFSRMRAPLIAAVNGTAAGGGLSLAIGADFTLAAESAVFKSAYTAIGLSGDIGATYTMPRLIGLRRARELMLTNRALKAPEALEWGLIDAVCRDEDLLDEASRLAEKLAAGAPLAFRACKSLLHDSFNATLEEQLASEAKWMVELAGSQDAQQAIAAFLAKQAPVFRGN